jgi:fatty-acyl-CoA synthase
MFRPRFAFSTLGCPDWSLEQAVEAALEYGYDGIELRLLDGAVIEPNLAEAERLRVRSVLEESGLPLCCLDSSLTLAQPETAGREELLDQGARMLELAVEWQAPYLRVFGSFGPPMNEWVAISSARSCLEDLARRAEELRVAVLLETHDIFRSTTAVRAIVRDIPCAGALWDVMHPYAFGEQVAASLAALGKSVLHVHLKDGFRNEDGGLTQTLLGEGCVPLEDVLRGLEQVEYDGFISMEWEKKWHPELAEPEIALPQHLAWVKGALERISS